MANVKKRFDLCAPKKYMKGTEEKTQWLKIGTMTVWDDGGISQQIDTLPTGTWWDGKISVFEQKQQEQTATAPPQATYEKPKESEGDGLPF